jgi:hypothetical protein
MEMEVDSAELLLPRRSNLEVETTVGDLKNYKSTGSDDILSELFQAGGETLVFVIHKLIDTIWNKEKMPDQWNESIVVGIQS